MGRVPSGDGAGSGVGARGHCAVCCGAEGTRVVSDSRISLRSKQIVPRKDALCQSYSQINTQLYRVQIDNLIICFNKIGMFSEDKVFSFE